MYDDFSSDYDRFVNWPGRLSVELPFLEKLIGDHDNADPVRVLDAACGTGMHAIALAKKGYTVAGADLSASMIDRARENAASSGANPRFEPVGFGSLASVFGQSSFDVLLCLGNSLPHLLDASSLAAALDDFNACLRPGGLLVIQNRNFDSVVSNRERWMEPQSHQEGAREWLFLRFYDYLPDGLIQFNIVTLTRTGQAAWDQQIRATRLYPQRAFELIQALSWARFGRMTAYGSLSGDLFNADTSGNLVMCAWKEEK